MPIINCPDCNCKLSAPSTDKPKKLGCSKCGARFVHVDGYPPEPITEKTAKTFDAKTETVEVPASEVKVETPAKKAEPTAKEIEIARRICGNQELLDLISVIERMEDKDRTEVFEYANYRLLRKKTD